MLHGVVGTYRREVISISKVLYLLAKELVRASVSSWYKKLKYGFVLYIIMVS